MAYRDILLPDGTTPDRSRSGRCSGSLARHRVTGAPPLIVVAGATATGKTALAIELAGSISALGRPAEIISADSRQVFRGLDIGTAKASTRDRDRVPHHGLDLVEPDQAFSVADFVDHVRPVLEDLQRRDGVVILAGGTGLYLRAVARGLDTASLPSDPGLRTRLEAEMADAGLPASVARLTAIAPRLASTVDQRNPRRVVRALEIAELAGDVPRPAHRGYPGLVAWVGLRLDAALHRERIAFRARAQFDSGLLDEAASLRARFDPTLPAFSAIGYREAWAVLDGELGRDAAIEADAKRTVAFARRQGTWFRSEPGIVWHDVGDGLPTATALDQVLPLVT